MGLLQQLPPVLQAAATIPVAPFNPPTPPTLQQLPQVTLDVRAQLVAEEAAQRAAQAQIQAPPSAPPMTFADAWRAIEQSGRGFPALGGAAAVQRAALSGVTLSSGAGLAGAGELGALMIQDPGHVVQLGGELQVRAATPTPQTATAPQQTATFSVLAPDAPASNPAFAAKPLDVAPAQAIATMGPLMPANGMPPATEAPKARRTRKPKVSEPATVGAIAAAPSPTLIGGAAPQVDPAVAGEDLEVYVDAIPNCDYESLHPYVDALCDILSDKYNPGGLRDVRCAPKESPLGFGGWRGAIRAIIIERPPQAGRYYLDARQNEIAAEAADAMRVVCERQGGLYVRGIK